MASFWFCSQQRARDDRRGEAQLDAVQSVVTDLAGVLRLALRGGLVEREVGRVPARGDFLLVLSLTGPAGLLSLLAVTPSETPKYPGEVGAAPPGLPALPAVLAAPARGLSLFPPGAGGCRVTWWGFDGTFITGNIMARLRPQSASSDG